MEGRIRLKLRMLPANIQCGTEEKIWEDREAETDDRNG
jgi:hypothetical protein